MSEKKLTGALRRALERIASGYEAQMGAQAGGLTFSVLASMLRDRGLVRAVKRRNGTRPYALTDAGRAALHAPEPR